VTLVTASELAAVSVTMAVPDLEGSRVDVALTVRVVAVSSLDTESKPKLEIVVSWCVFSSNDQTTVLSPFPETRGVNCLAPPLGAVAVGGLTATPVTEDVGVKLSTKSLEHPARNITSTAPVKPKKNSLCFI
jgi:hypothetical protein